MNDSTIMDVTEKQQYCQNVYDNNIIRVMSFLDDMKTIADSYNHMLPVTCFTNFRDALFHFRKIYYASNKNEIMEQGFALKEHLNRSRTDAIVSLLNFFSYGIRMLLNDDTICGMYGKKLRVFLHKMQNINLFKRINGMMIFSYDVDNITDGEVYQLIMDFSLFLKSNNLAQEFAKRIQRKNDSTKPI